MNINELDSYNLADAVKFHRRLNPRIWGRDEHLLPEVQDKLLAIAADFQEFLGVEDLNVKDITISGSNAAYSYTKNSDIDLHIVVEMPDDPVYQELFNAKKYQYNDEHNIKIGGADVELYVQPADQTHHSLGIYSVKNSDWISVPQRKRAQIDDACVRDKVADLDARIHSAVQSKNLDRISTLWDKIKVMRQSGLEQHGEFGCENIAFKMLRNSGCIAALKDAKTALQDLELSLREADRPQKRFRYGFSEDMMDPTQQPYSSANGVAPTTKSFLEDADNSNNIVQDFIQHVTTELGIDPVPEIHLHTDPDWSENNHSFGRYDPDSHTLNVSMPNRHVMDVLRTVAHELVHCSQNQQHGQLPDDAGETGSRWENDANARAGIIMRDWANSHPEHFAQDALEESASGYIPKNKKEAKMPQYAMALSVDIKPGQVGKEANKLALKTGRNGEPGLLQPDAENLLREFSEFTEEQENLFEISMSPTSLKKLSAQTGALAGMEFEMCVPNTEGDDNNGDQEPDYEYDERCRSIEDAVQFFHDGDWNGRRDVERLRDRMQNDYVEWLYERLDRDFQNESEYLISEWVANNVDESEWNPDDLEGEARQEALDEFIANVDADPSSDYYQQALDEYRDESRDSYDEGDWLDAEDLDLMSYVENAYDVTWPHWSSVGSGETSIEDVADSFSNAVGRPVQASGSYHSGRVERPSTRNPHYLVEPDSSIDVDDRDDRGLEFVSPPLPIEELLSDLNKVKAWADKTGCYTNDSTGLHINVSVPGWTQGTDQLDYVKLALLLGDEHVLESFGRAGNTYCKSAMGKIVDIVRQRPDRAQLLMNRMKKGLDQLATRLVHSRQTEKYTSINMKDGYIEFRSPGGDWLNDNFAEIDNTLRRFTVAMSAAVDPEAYRKEYLKKLYKLLDVNSEKDPLSYFAKYAAGELPKAALKSFVRQAQLQRDVKRGEKTGPMWWRVYKEGKDARNGAVIEVVASSKEEALDKAAKDWGVFSDEYRRAMYAEPVRPYKQEAGFVTLNGRPSNPDGNYVIVNAATQVPAYRYMASDMTDATLVLRQWITANPGTQWDFKRDPEMRLGQPGAAPAAQQQDDVTPFEIYNRDTGAVVSTVMARTAQEALAELDQFRAEQVQAQGITIPRANALYGVRHAGSTASTAQSSATQQYYDVTWSQADDTGTTINHFRLQARSADEAVSEMRDRLYRQGINPENLKAEVSRYQDAPGSTMDLQRQRAAQDQQQGGTVDVATDQPAPQPAGMGQWNGQWRVLVNGQEVYRFGNIGNSQADANRIAAAWLRQNGQGVSGEGFEVYPVMAESLREYRMPQPSQGPGRYRDLNEPLGPETPPKMPAGTIKVDVSDMYDWYKLGQKISDLNSIKPGELGAGPPSTVFAFGSEDLENMYSHELTKLGLKTHDLDEPGEEDMDESVGDRPSDPTSNREFVSNKYLVKFTPTEMLIYKGGELVYRRNGDYADLKRSDVYMAKSLTSTLWNKDQKGLIPNLEFAGAEKDLLDQYRKFEKLKHASPLYSPERTKYERKSLQITRKLKELRTTQGEWKPKAALNEVAIDADQVLHYVKKTHAPEEFNIEYSITDHPAWELKNISLSELNLDPDGEVQDPYNRTNWVDYDVVRDLMPKIVQVLKSKPIVVDSDGWIIDGNHRAMAAAEAGLTSVPALVPAEVKEGVAEARTNPDKNIKRWAGKLDLAAFAENIKDKENWGVSMTVEPKLGINPRVGISEDTPKGIYFYPLEYFIHMVSRYTSLPWGDNMPYMQLFQYDRSGEMTRQTQVDPAQLKQALSQYCPEEIIQQVIDEPDSLYDGTPYWIIYDCLSRLGKSDETNIIRWNKVLRDLGFTSVFDSGRGWIATGEPTQGIILDPRIIKQHKTFVNRNPTILHRKYDINRLADAINWSDYYNNESQRQQVPYGHPDRQKTMLAVANDMLRPFLGKTSEEAKEMGLDQALKTASDKVIEILKQGAVQENFADGKNPGRKEIDPDVYEDLSNSIIARTARQIVPTIRAKSTPEGYVYLSTQDGLSLVIGCNIAGGSIDINIGSQPMETTSSGPHKGAVTKIIEAVYQAAAKQYGAPIKQGTLSIDHDAGHGVWQHIAQKLGLQHDAYMVKENFADGKNPGRKGLSKRMGVNTKASVSTLRNVAKHSSGEKQRMAHWLANMKAGRAKNK